MCDGDAAAAAEDDDDDDNEDDVVVDVASPVTDAPPDNRACRRSTMLWDLSTASPCLKADATARAALRGEVKDEERY